MRFRFAKVSQIFTTVSAFERGAAGGAAGGAAIGFADAVCCKIMAERITCPQATRERTLFVSDHMSSLLSTVKEFLL